MKYLLDAVVILIFLLCIVIGRKRGFIKTVAGIVALAAALLVSSLFCAPVAEFVYDRAVEPSIAAAVDEQVAQAQGNATQQLEDAYASLPPFVRNLLTQAGVEDAGDLADALPTQTAASVTQNVCAVVRPVLLPLIKAICSLLLFLITYIVAVILLRVLNLVAKLPVLKQLNKTLGLIGGVVSGALWAMLAVTVIQILAATGVAPDTLTMQTVGETTVVNWLIGINPLGGTLTEVLNVR